MEVHFGTFKACRLATYEKENIFLLKSRLGRKTCKGKKGISEAGLAEKML